MFVATGNKIGVVMRINGAMSMTIPNSNSMATIINVITLAFHQMFISVSDSLHGTLTNYDELIQTVKELYSCTSTQIFLMYSTGMSGFHKVGSTQLSKFI